MPVVTKDQVVAQLYQLPHLEELIAETVGQIKEYMLPAYLAGRTEEYVVLWLWERVRDAVVDSIVGEVAMDKAVEAITAYLLPPYVVQPTRERVEAWLGDRIQGTVAICMAQWPVG